MRVELPNPRGRLKPEMFATAAIETGSSSPALFVPDGAVQEINGEPVVFVRTQSSSERFTMRLVDLGPSQDGLRRVTGGLVAGDMVVTEGSFILKSQMLRASLEEE